MAQDYRIINLATGQETYLYDVPEDVVMLAAREHVEETGNSHFVQVLPEMSFGVNAVASGSCEPEFVSRRPHPDDGADFNVGDLFDQVVREYEAERAALKQRVEAHIDAFAAWVSDMPEAEADGVRQAILEGAELVLGKRDF